MNPVALEANIDCALATEKLDGTCCYVTVYKGEYLFEWQLPYKFSWASQWRCSMLCFIMTNKKRPLLLHIVNVVNWIQKCCRLTTLWLLLVTFIANFINFLAVYWTEWWLIFFFCRATLPLGSTRQETQQTGREEVQKVPAFSQEL